MKKKKILSLCLAMLMALTVFTPYTVTLVKADTIVTATPVKVNSYSELDEKMNNGMMACEFNMSGEDVKVNFTLTEDAYVRVATVMDKKTNNQCRLNGQIRSKSLITEYANESSAFVYKSGIYSFDLYAKLEKGTYIILYHDSYGDNLDVDVYIGVLPTDTDFLSATYLGASDWAGQSVKLKINHVDPVEELIIDVVNYGSEGMWSTKICGKPYTLDKNSEVIVPISQSYNHINIYMKDSCGAEHYVYYGVLNKCTATITGITDKTWTGSEIKQNKVVVKGGYDYATYNAVYKDNINPGVATITFVGKGNWIGSVTKTFKITKPTSIKVSKVKGVKVTKVKKKSVSIKWIKTNKAVKYQVKYSTNKKLKGSKIKTTIKNKVTLKKLKSKKKYYFRVRAISSTGYTGKWSSLKKIKTK